ncbi:hypothetical protein HK097_004006 [Rhizophlyctis rosea]|uniref:DNA-directed DNA polymerase n=1 Tax=Rhizophlyctis rosea TaxID=64517 RepID=A0AAD5X9J4_9FUNG|nr:hypothetical protein HK097_004006 [Rhizophlyctis rosea]
MAKTKPKTKTPPVTSFFPQTKRRSEVAQLTKVSSKPAVSPVRTIFKNPFLLPETTVAKAQPERQAKPAQVTERQKGNLSQPAEDHSTCGGKRKNAESPGEDSQSKRYKPAAFRLLTQIRPSELTESETPHPQRRVSSTPRQTPSRSPLPLYGNHSDVDRAQSGTPSSMYDVNGLSDTQLLQAAAEAEKNQSPAYQTPGPANACTPSAFGTPAFSVFGRDPSSADWRKCEKSFEEPDPTPSTYPSMNVPSTALNAVCADTEMTFDMGEALAVSTPNDCVRGESPLLVTPNSIDSPVFGQKTNPSPPPRFDLNDTVDDWIFTQQSQAEAGAPQSFREAAETPSQRSLDSQTIPPTPPTIQFQPGMLKPPDMNDIPDEDREDYEGYLVLGQHASDDLMPQLDEMLLADNDDNLTKSIARASMLIRALDSPNRPGQETYLNVSGPQMESDLSVRHCFKKFGFSDDLAETYVSEGIADLFQWQLDCLKTGGIMEETTTNLLYSAPTSAGKTMVAELMMLKRVLLTRTKAIFIVPFVSIVLEKVKYMQKMWASERLNIVGYHGNTGPRNFDEVDIAICTIERANSLVNRLIMEKSLDTLGIMVVDELHMVGGTHNDRGYTLELLLLKAMYHSKGNLQIVGMSATVPKIEKLALWLDAKFFQTDFRPVELVEYIFAGNTLRARDGKVVRSLKCKPRDDSGRLVALVEEIAKDKLSTLVFCFTHQGCENAAKEIVKGLQNRLPVDAETKLQRSKVSLELQATPARLDPTLEFTIPEGVAFHHAGLTTDEREIIEDAFRAGSLHTLVATTTLANGVNLPARRVIFREWKPWGKNPIAPQDYQQMRGRAGRKGKDSLGESILMCSPLETSEVVNKVINVPLSAFESCLHPRHRGLARAILEIIAADTNCVRELLTAYSRHTLYHALLDNEVDADMAIDKAIDYLKHNQFVIVRQVEVPEQNSNGRPRHISRYAAAILEATHLGRATVSSALSPEDALVVFQELSVGQESMFLRTELHVVYHVTPPFLRDKIKLFQENAWMGILNHHLEKPGQSAEYNVGKAVGARSAVVKMGTGQPLTRKETQILQRYCLALVLNDLIEEKRIGHVCEKYKLDRGTLQQLQTQSATFAGMVHVFLEELKWYPMSRLVSQLQDRLNFGIQPKLLDLVKIPGMTGNRARLLWDANYTTVASIASSTTDEIVAVLSRPKPFLMEDSDDPTVQYQQQMEYRELCQIIEAAKGMVTLEEVREAEMAMAEAEKENNRPTSPNKKTPVRHGGKGGGKRSGKRTRSTTKTVGSSEKRLLWRAGLQRYQQAEPADTSMFKTPSRPPRQKRALPLVVESPELVSPPNAAVPEDSSSDQSEDVGLDGVSILITEDFIDTFVRDVEWWPSCVIHPLTEEPAKSNQYGRLLGLAIFAREEQMHYVNLRECEPDWLQKIAKALKRRNTVITCFDAKAFVRALLRNNVQPPDKFKDPVVAGWCLDPERKRKDLAGMYKEFFPADAVARVGNEMEICLWEALQVKKLMEKLETRMDKEGMLETFLNMEMPIQVILGGMEHYGVGFHHQDFHKYYALFQKTMKDLEIAAYRSAGRMFNLANPPEVAEVLYDEKKLLIEDGKSVGVGAPGCGPLVPKKCRSTRKEILLKLVDKYPEEKLPTIIMEHRRLSKLYGTHLIPLRMAAVTSDEFEMKRIHCSFTTHTATGRINTHNPNLQNIPHPKDTNGDGLELNSANLRNAFLAAPDMVLVIKFRADQSLAAQLAGDKKLLDILNSGGDIFNLMALEMDKQKYRSVKDVSKEDRQKAKGICYGVLYGQRPKSAAEDLGSTLDYAEQFIAKFKEMFPKIDSYKRKVVNDCTKNAFVLTALGRKRYLPHINSKSSSERGRAERQAINTNIQGSAADLVKTVMIKVSESFTRKWGDIEDSRRRPRMIMQIHDELVFEVPRGLVNAVKQILQTTMNEQVPGDVAFPVNFKIGALWGSLE